MNLKDYILDEVVTTTENKTTKKHRTEYTFKLLYENDTDFILQKTTKQTDKSFVCIVSRGQYYIKNNKTDEIEKVEHIDQIKAFKKGMSIPPTFEKLTWKPFEYYSWTSTTNVNDCFKCMLGDVEITKILANKKLNPMVNWFLIDRYRSNPETLNNIAYVNNVMSIVYPKFALNLQNFSELKTLTHNIIECKLDVNKMKKLKTLIQEFDTHTRDNCFRMLLENGQFGRLINEFGCDLKTLLEWLLYTITFRNGLTIRSNYDYYSSSANFNINDYVDYLNQQQTMYGKVKEKYPTYWLSEELMMTNKHKEWLKLNETRLFSLNQEKMKAFEYENDIYKVIVPMVNTDILDEAEQQHHCVASYIDLINQGKTHIVFIRQKLNEDVSCLTVEISNNNEIVQVRGLRNRPYTKMEYDFMVEWAKAKKLDLVVGEPEED